MKKFVINIIKFISIIIIADVISIFLVHPYFGERYYSTKFSYFFQQKEHFNAVIFGSSQTYRQIDPKLLDQILADYDTSTFNFATSGTGQPETYFLYEEFLKTIKKGTLKYALIEITALTYINENNLHSKKNIYWHNFPYFCYSIKYILSSNFPSSEKLMYIRQYTYSYLLKITRSIEFLLKSAPVDTPYFLGKNKDGFLPLDQLIQDRPGNRSLEKRKKRLNKHPNELIDNAQLIKESFAKPDHDTSLNQVHLNKLLNLIDISNRNGIYLIFIIPPRWTGMEELLALKKYLPHRHIIELADPGKYPELYLFENHFDIGHLNTKGIKIFTQYLGREMLHRLKHPQQ